ncbi:MAG: hypothetical protein KAH01_08325 [Caldisericia bacterium]|nr:hypothetical protein [Caldisericia bacterium]
MKITENKIYLFYVLIGSVYFVSKVLFYAFGSVCGTMALLLGLLATIVTIIIGIYAFKEFVKKPDIPLAHYLAVVIPLFILVYTPIFMITKLGVPISHFQTGKLIIFIIFECLAVAQIILSIFMSRCLRLKP